MGWIPWSKNKTYQGRDKLEPGTKDGLAGIIRRWCWNGLNDVKEPYRDLGRVCSRQREQSPSSKTLHWHLNPEPQPDLTFPCFQPLSQPHWTFPLSQLHAFGLFPLSIVSSSSSLGEIILQNPAEMSYMTQLPTYSPTLTPPDSSSSKSWSFAHHCFLYTVSNSNTAQVNVDCNWFV